MITAEKVREWMSKPVIQKKMKKLAEKDENGRSLVDKIICEWLQLEKKKASHFIYYKFFDVVKKKMDLKDGELEDILLQPQYRRAVSNVCRSVGNIGLSTPQCFSAPLVIVWNFTNACNLNCKHCYQDAHNKLDDELTLEEKLNVVDQMVYNDVSAIAFAGGEPLLHKDFWPVVEHCKEVGMYISVATNGTLITKEVAKRLMDIGVQYVEVSIDSAVPERHDEFRGGKDYFKRTVEGVKNAVEAGLSVGVATVASKTGYQEMDDIIKLTKELGAQKFYAFNFIPTGRAKDIIDIDLTPQERENMLDKLYTEFLRKEIFSFTTCPQYGRKCYEANPEGVIVNSHYGYIEGAQAKMLADYIGGCGAGRCYCAFQPNGKVTPCVFMPLEIVGDLKKETLKEIWDKETIMTQLRDRELLKGHCKVCDYRAMCGGCRARAYGYFGDYFEADPGCKYNQEAYDRLVAEHTN